MTPRLFELRVRPVNDFPALAPYIDGIALTELVGDFERSQGWHPAGGYDSLLIWPSEFIDPSRYYLGTDPNQFPEDGRAWVLGCTCGEVGCWPLEVRITVDGPDVIWSDFAQPHREQWIYTGFGPFIFDRAQYQNAVEQGIAALMRARA